MELWGGLIEDAADAEEGGLGRGSPLAGHVEIIQELLGQLIAKIPARSAAGMPVDLHGIAFGSGERFRSNTSTWPSNAP